MRKISATWVLAPTGQLLPNTIIHLSDAGAVVAIEHADGGAALDKNAGVEYYEGVLMPGMVNGHCHLELSYLLGSVSEGGGLVQFIREIMAVRGNFSAEEQQQKAITEDRKMWAEGVQGVCDISNGTASFEAKSTSHIEYQTYAEFFNMPSADELEEYYASATSHIAVANELGLWISPTPHSNYMVGDLLFRRGVADADCLSIHFMETRTELEYFDGRGEMYDFVNADGMTPDFLHYGGQAERLIATIPADMPLLLVHNTLITEEQVRMLTGHFTNLTFVVCPLSNHYIERAKPPVVMLRDMGANVAIGTDSLTSNHKLSMAGEIERLMVDNPELELGQVLSWATLGGAKGLGRESELGTFDVGKTPGVVLLEGINTKTLRPSETPLSTRRIV